MTVGKMIVTKSIFYLYKHIFNHDRDQKLSLVRIFKDHDQRFVIKYQLCCSDCLNPLTMTILVNYYNSLTRTVFVKFILID